MAIFIFCITLSIIAWVGLSFLYYKKLRWSGAISISVGLLCAFFIFMICIISYIGYSTPPKSDKELYLDFYKNIMAKVKTFDEGYKPFIDAAAANNTMTAIGIASEIDQPIRQLWADIDRVSVPELKDQNALKELTNAKKLISYAYLSKCEGISAYLEYYKNPSTYSLAIVGKKAKDAQSQLFIGMGSLITAGIQLGLKPDDIKS